jgi:hypothetical protein
VTAYRALHAAAEHVKSCDERIADLTRRADLVAALALLTKRAREAACYVHGHVDGPRAVEVKEALLRAVEAAERVLP